jgi:hypothetical protein
MTIRYQDRIEAQTEEGRQFLAAWDRAGNPPVSKTMHACQGQAHSKHLGPRDAVIYAASKGPMRLSDDGRTVRLEWDFTSTVFGAPGGSASLSFDRAEPQAD